MISVSGTKGAGMGAFAGLLRSTVDAAPVEEPRVVAPVVEQLLDEQYDRREEPSGGAWASRVPPTGSWPLLEKSGAMRRSRRVVAVEGAVEASYGGPSRFHQRGTVKMVARKLLPEDRIPPGWSARIASARSAWWRSRLGVS